MSIFSRLFGVFSKKHFQDDVSLPPSQIHFLPTTETQLCSEPETRDTQTAADQRQIPQTICDVPHKLQVLKQGGSYYALDSAQLKHYQDLELKRTCARVTLQVVPLKDVPRKLLQLVKSASQNDLTKSAPSCYFRNVHAKFTSQVDIASYSGNADKGNLS